MPPALSILGIVALILSGCFLFRLLSKKMCSWLEHAIEHEAVVFGIAFAGWIVIATFVVIGIYTMFYPLSLWQ